MMIFWIVVALFIAAALLFVIPPLISRHANNESVERNTLNITIYRDQLAELERDLENDVITREQYEQGRLELEQRLLEDVPEGADASVVANTPKGKGRLAAVLVGIAIPVFAIGIYQWLGTPESISPSGRAAATAENATPSDMSAQISAMVSQLAQRLEENPADPEGWSMLGRSYLVLGRLDDAIAAYEKAISLANDDPNLLVDYADALAMASGAQSLEGRPIQLIDKALTIDPDNQKGLWLAGTAAFERADFQQALEYWRKLYRMLPQDTEDARVMQGNIKEAESLLAGRSNVASVDGDGAGQDSPQNVAKDLQDSHVTGVVKLDKSLAGRFSENDTVFIFARASEGPRMPLAVLRARVKDLPLDFSLDDSMAINPAMTISQFPEVIVVARISKSGNAMPQSGDVQGTSDVLRVGVDEAKIVMNEVLP